MSVISTLEKMIDSHGSQGDPFQFLYENSVYLFQNGGGSFSYGHDFEIDLHLTKDGELMDVFIDQGEPFKIMRASFEENRRKLAESFPKLTEENAMEYYKIRKKEIARRIAQNR